MKFIDETEIYAVAGCGGDGMTSYRRARNRPKLGPDGGNGGNGGDVVLVADRGLNTLSPLRYRQSYKAEPGGRGASNEKTGRCGTEKQITVPCGTVICDRATGERLGELTRHQARLLVARGGKRGYGNAHFTSATNRCPHFSIQGQKGEERHLKLSLKLLADVGLAGFPNAGKSTLLSRLSAARPRIADYPFTTLTPNLGVVETGSYGENSFVVADIPGLIEGASRGKGLGQDFLKHLERTRIVIYVLDAFSPGQPCLISAYKTLHHELTQYQPDLGLRSSLVLFTKTDLVHGATGQMQAVEEAGCWFRQQGISVLEVSAITGQGLQALKSRLAKLLASPSARKQSDAAASASSGTEMPDIVVSNGRI